MTQHPQWGVEIAKLLLDAMEEASAKHGLASAFRMTPNDTREFDRPPAMRSGAHWENMLELFEDTAGAGAELLSIESVGGKEVGDDALMLCDLPQIIFALCVMGVRDMDFLWRTLQDIADRTDARCAGDSACGFANTAMVLAEQRMIPSVFAAVVRAISAVRSLVRIRTRSRRTRQGLRLREPHPQGHHRLPHRDGGKDRIRRAPKPARKHRRDGRGHMEQRVRRERQAPGRHGSHLQPRAARLRLPALQPGAERRPEGSAHAAALARRIRRGARPPGLLAHSGKHLHSRRGDRRRARPLPGRRRRCGTSNRLAARRGWQPETSESSAGAALARPDGGGGRPPCPRTREPSSTGCWARSTERSSGPRSTTSTV